MASKILLHNPMGTDGKSPVDRNWDDSAEGTSSTTVAKVQEEMEVELYLCPPGQGPEANGSGLQAPFFEHYLRTFSDTRVFERVATCAQPRTWPSKSCGTRP